MDTEILQTVLTEILEEQKASSQDIKEFSTSITQKMNSIHQNVSRPKSIVEAEDIKQVQTTLMEGIRQIQQTLEEQPKNPIRQYRILLFPEQYADHYYRIIFGRLLFWMMIFLLCTYLFALGRQGVESWERIQLKNLEANHAKAAFDYLYQHADKEGKKKMIDSWQKGRLSQQFR